MFRFRLLVSIAIYVCCDRALSPSYQSPDGAFQIGHVCQILQHGLEVVVIVVKPSPKHSLADDVGYCIVQAWDGVKGLAYTEK